VEQAGDQIRGWKSIAAAINTSPRTARRWARRRELPVRQIAGHRKSVFMLPQELEEWQRAQAFKGAHSLGAAPAAAPAQSQPDHGDAPQQLPNALAAPSRSGPRAVHALLHKPWWLVAILCVFLLALVGVAWVASPTPHSAGFTPKPIQIRTVNLRVTRPDGWQALLTVADGGAGQFGGLPGQPAVVLRPRLADAGLMLEIARVDGRPVVDGPGPPTPFVLLLEQRVVVGVQRPFPFQVEWAGAPAPAIPNTINR
jgi:hypothetical protein